MLSDLVSAADTATADSDETASKRISRNASWPSINSRTAARSGPGNDHRRLAQNECEICPLSLKSSPSSKRCSSRQRLLTGVPRARAAWYSLHHSRSSPSDIRAIVAAALYANCFAFFLPCLRLPNQRRALRRFGSCRAVSRWRHTSRPLKRPLRNVSTTDVRWKCTVRRILGRS